MKLFFRFASHVIMTLLIAILPANIVLAGSDKDSTTNEISTFPRSLESYNDTDFDNVSDILAHRIDVEPFNLVASIIFLLAIIHTFMASKLTKISHRLLHEHKEKIERREAEESSVSIKGELFHFLGEVEVVFGIWLIPLIISIVVMKDWSSAVSYFHNKVDLTEAAFVVVIMVLASTRPILRLAEKSMVRISKWFGGSLAALWLTILTIGPLLGSFITEPAAMTICAMLLSRKFYELQPSMKFRYMTIALLFVNISVGGVLTHFAAPPVLMVAGAWNWGTGFMLANFGWKVIIGIAISNFLYYWLFRKELASMQHDFALRELKDEIEQKYLTKKAVDEAWQYAADEDGESDKLVKVITHTTGTFTATIRKKMESVDLSNLEERGYDKGLIKEAFDKRFEEASLYRARRWMPMLLAEEDRATFIDPDWDKRDDPVPTWITLVHALFMIWTIINAHHTELFIIGFLFFLGFTQVTAQYQNRIQLRSAMLVGFFLAALVGHGGLQAWWIAPILGSLSEGMLTIGATVLTAFNDNAAITYLSTLVPGFTDGLKYAVVAGAVAGGGLTVIANAPNPAGQALLKQHFDGAVSPQRLVLSALVPTIIVWLCLALL